MLYTTTFRDIHNTNFKVEIDTGGSGTSQITLCDPPVIITTESEGIFSPIKSRSCSINILTEGAMLDLYAVRPHDVHVIIRDLNRGKQIFKGYATPMKYGQDWTSKDTLTLECVDYISSLKSIKYQQQDPTCKRYISIYNLLCYLCSEALPQDTAHYKFYWPATKYSGANGYSWTDGINKPPRAIQFLQNIKLNEANFFDDDDEQTAWTDYEVLEEICKYLHVSAVPFEDALYFIDYQYVAEAPTNNNWNATYHEIDNIDGYIGNLNIYKKDTIEGPDQSDEDRDYAAGTAQIEMDDLYNYISLNTNRYDLDEICSDVNEEKNHISITKEKNFGSAQQVWTHTEESGWWIWSNTTTHKWWIFKTYCRMDPKSLWTHKYYKPATLAQMSNTNGQGYFDGTGSGTTYANTQFKVSAENKYINTIGASMLHYATMDQQSKKPTKLDWTDVIMFNCFHDTIQYYQSAGFIKLKDLLDDNSIFEKPVLEYTSDYELNYSPQTGKSWINLKGSLWFQRNESNDDYTLTVTNYKTHKQNMAPIEDVTDIDPFVQEVEPYGAGPAGIFPIMTKSDGQTYYYNYGWPLMKFRLQIGDKYWSGSQWTTTPCDFYVNFQSQWEDDDKQYAGQRCLTWMDMVSNTDYEDKVGTEGYCIPIEKADAVSGQLKLTLYTPRTVPAKIWTTTSGTYYFKDANDFYKAYAYPATAVTNNQNQHVSLPITWFMTGPVVFMKDFAVNYIYTSDKEWFLDQEKNTDDVKYSNVVTENYKYEKNNTLKIQSWQKDRPIAKSFPIIDFTQGTTKHTEYVDEIQDLYNIYSLAPADLQENNIIERELRHYKAPRLIYDANLQYNLSPCTYVTLANTSYLNNRTFIVDRKEYDVKYSNVATKLIEYGDASTSAS